ncbi:TPA: H/ACA RNA-protein complex protein Gar1 [Candidatus Bathyarchaeota archaeon]|nr:H/ACA RNA-protein complex protein Gar1 [Candidatus Bathyarchaeota archaeon]
MGLQRLGRVLSLTPSLNMVVKTEEAPKIGSTVIDENLKVVGRVFDVIGPVTAPYAVIKPNIKDPEQLTNKQLYLLLPKNRSRK